MNDLVFLLRIAYSPEVMPFGFRPFFTDFMGSTVKSAPSSTRLDNLAQAGMFSRWIREHLSAEDQDFLIADFTTETDGNSRSRKEYAAAMVAKRLYPNHSVSDYAHSLAVMQWFGLFRKQPSKLSRVSYWRIAIRLKRMRSDILEKIEREGY